jgi:flagellar protein FlaG
MTIEAVAGSMTTARNALAPEKVESDRKDVANETSGGSAEDSKKVAPEEMISQIKALTENGLYSVRFESDNDQLIVKVVDRETNEVIRQIPPENLIDVMANLKDLRGNMVDTVS